ncbi:hypothetical protein EXIGLDRAFT_750866 [Exidia glandulosa HHB12029]|uniref:Uncharacterized protein n=1 Tax=Exidia glandulosa HHB12029 TaxID=1314781 RepID=A0A165G5C3_EXIGL|nr:hypothetical protein EXIGLDRAFT_750866 [Exidia glandulosa HHB12029]
MQQCSPIFLLANNGNNSYAEDLAPVLNRTFGLWNASDTTANLTNVVDIALMKSTLQGLYCAADWPGRCLGLCPNADVSGFGVRYAFYIQSLTSAALMAISPDDAQAACWSAAILTASVIIPAMVQKAMKKLTLHHAMLCLNFATMSAVAALASAPVCDVWRAPDFPEQDFPAKQGGNGRSVTLATAGSPRLRTSQLDGEDERPESQALPSTPTLLAVPVPGEQRSTSQADDTENDSRRRDTTTHSRQESLPGSPSVVIITGHEFRKLKWASSGYRSRFFLSLALLTQVSLQWAWAVFLFTSPSYAQEACNGCTQLLLFGYAMTVESMLGNAKYVLFPLWLLACMSVTLLYVIALSYNSMVEYPLIHMPNASSLSGSSNWIVRTFVNTLEWSRRAWAEPYGEKKRILVANVFAAGIWAILVVHSEVQVWNLNPVLSGENSDFGFGQFSALMLAFVPIWPIIVALNKEQDEIRRERAPFYATAPTLDLRDTGSLSLEEQVSLLGSQTSPGLVMPASPRTPSPSTALPATPLPALPEWTPPQWPEHLLSPSSSPSSTQYVPLPPATTAMDTASWPSTPPPRVKAIQSPPPRRRGLETDGGLGLELVPIVVTPPAEDAAR